MADPISIAIITLVSLNIVTGVFTPLILAGAYLIKHLQESSCCGGSMKVFRSEEHLEKHKEKDIELNQEILIDVIKKLSIDKH